MVLNVAGNFCFLELVNSNYQDFIYCPNAYSDIQKTFLDRRFTFIQEKINDIKKGEPLEKSDFLGVNSFNECKKYNVLVEQNRLFESLPFECPEGFTSFRKKAEPFLPEMFDQSIDPWDGDVINEIDYYFHQTKLPSTYFNDRNGLVGRDYSTKFSAFLSCGALDVRYLYNQIKDYELRNGSNKSTYWLVFELLWREFFYWHYQKHKKKYFSQNGLHGPLDFSEFEIFEISELRTKVDHSFFQCALNELEETGFLSNRVRQIFASVWLNDLNLNWRSGAKLFERYLIDYDVFSNYGNWMYLAGVGVDPRGKRYFNVEKQLSNYDPKGKYVKKWGG